MLARWVIPLILILNLCAQLHKIHRGIPQFVSWGILRLTPYKSSTEGALLCPKSTIFNYDKKALKILPFSNALRLLCSLWIRPETSAALRHVLRFPSRAGVSLKAGRAKIKNSFPTALKNCFFVCRWRKVVSWCR